MNNIKIAEKIYFAILEHRNGWSKEDIAELNYSDYRHDPLFEIILEALEEEK